MRSAPFILSLTLLVMLGATATESTPPGPGPQPVASTTPDKAAVAKADEQAKAGLELMQSSNGDTSKTVEAALSFSQALQVYDAAGDHEKAREMQANIYWCKKRMNIDELERFVAKKGKDPRIAAELARIEKVVDKQIPTDQADTYLADADRYALEHPDQVFLIAVRYFEVAERFVGTPASLKAQRKSLDYQAKAPVADPSTPDTLFTRPAKPPEGRQPVPTPAELKTAKDAVRKLYKDDFAERKDSARRAFGWRLLEQAKASKDDPKLRYALLSEATQLAVAIRDVAGVLAFSDELANGFEGVDAVTEKKTQLSKFKTDLGAGAALKLLDDPRDPSANAVAGKYFCLTAEKWEIGLPLLALGNDPALAKLAGMETANPTGAAQQMELADAWYALGNARTEQGAAAWRRAMLWYKKAQPSLTGVSKERVEQTLDDMFPTVFDPAFKWEKITDKQWEKLKPAPIPVNCLKEKQDTGIVLRDGEKARIVPHPSETWIFQSWWMEGAQAVTWKGAGGRHGMGVGQRFPLGAMTMWVKEADRKAPGVISGPGKLMLGPADASYGQKGIIRVKVVMEE